MITLNHFTTCTVHLLLLFPPLFVCSSGREPEPAAPEHHLRDKVRQFEGKEVKHLDSKPDLPLNVEMDDSQIYSFIVR